MDYDPHHDITSGEENKREGERERKREEKIDLSGIDVLHKDFQVERKKERKEERERKQRENGIKGTEKN